MSVREGERDSKVCVCVCLGKQKTDRVRDVWTLVTYVTRERWGGGGERECV